MFQKLISRIAKELDKSNLPYMIIGGYAVLYYGEPRVTRDIDITLGVGIERQNDVLKIPETLGLKILVDDPSSFIKEYMVLPVLEESSGIKIDFIFSFTPYEQEAIKRAKEVDIEGVKVRIASVEDLMIHKIFAGRPRDIEDVKNILLKKKSFDKGYITKWLKQFDVSMSLNFTDKFIEVLNSISKK